MRRKREDVAHEFGPFAGIKSGDVVRVSYDGAAASLIQVTRVNQHSIEGLDGEFKCKITIVSPNEMRFYGELGPNRETVLRNVGIKKIEQPAPRRWESGLTSDHD